jgi:hypothetical protein
VDGSVRIKKNLSSNISYIVMVADLMVTIHKHQRSHPFKQFPSVHKQKQSKPIAIEIRPLF